MRPLWERWNKDERERETQQMLTDVMGVEKFIYALGTFFEGYFHPRVEKALSLVLKKELARMRKVEKYLDKLE